MGLETQMLEALEFLNVGPAPELGVEFKPRMNFLTGDNGLGKSFLLDVAWWSLTRTWARHSVLPHGPPAEPSIAYRYTKTTAGSYEYTSTFNRETEEWSVKNSRPAIPGLVLYAQVDGGFSVWDPARNYWKKDSPDRPPSYLFAAHEVWEGSTLCEGLIRDWATWQREAGPTFDQLKKVLRTLSPSPDEEIRPGDLKKLSLDDPKRYPTLQMPYGQEIPVILASAGMRRVIALAYLLVWTWQEHLAACQLRGSTPTKEIIFLIDEIEAHLHPRWQRRIVPALLDVMEALTGEHDVQVQLIAATHSPLVLASSEAHFDPTADAIWDLDLVEGKVELKEWPWQRRGDANAWLTSSVFELQEPRSVEAEYAILQALALLQQGQEVSVENVDRVDGLLRGALSDVDRFWVRWSAFAEKIREAG